MVLASGLGRVADARPIDTCGTGKLDVVVAEFGSYRTGKILLLKNVGEHGQRPRFEPEVLDLRTGTIHVPVCDLDGDGRPDFLALVSNEHECVEAFLNQGGGKFHRRTLSRTGPDLRVQRHPAVRSERGREARHPLHQRRRVRQHIPQPLARRPVAGKPGKHAIQVPPAYGHARGLRCIGRRLRRRRRPGHSVVSFLPKNLKPETVDLKSMPSIVLLEQVSPGQFVRHTLERGFPCHSALVLGDFNHDGKLDFAVGNHVAGGRSDFLGQNWLTIWWNKGKALRR